MLEIKSTYIANTELDLDKNNLHTNDLPQPISSLKQHPFSYLLW